MNILHHKSWHVRNKDNIQKVRRDEAKAAEEEKQRQKKIAIAESEARINILRARSSKTGAKLVEYDDFLNQERVNLFEKEEKGQHNEDKNEEVEQEKKKEQETYEKKIGLLKYLVDDDLDLKNQPWYKTVRRREENKDKDVEIDVKIKRRLDPLKMIEDLTGETERKKHKKKHKKEKSKDKEETKRPKTIEELRAERLKREAEERLKAQRLISGNKDLGKSAEPKVEVDDRKRKYNNQFNPEYSKY